MTDWAIERPGLAVAGATGFLLLVFVGIVWLVATPIDETLRGAPPTRRMPPRPWFARESPANHPERGPVWMPQRVADRAGRIADVDVPNNVVVVWDAARTGGHWAEGVGVGVWPADARQPLRLAVPDAPGEVAVVQRDALVMVRTRGQARVWRVTDSGFAATLVRDAESSGVVDDLLQWIAEYGDGVDPGAVAEFVAEESQGM